MRFPKEQSKYLIDNTWVPYTRDEGWKYGGISLPEATASKPSSSGSILTNLGKFTLTPDEVELLKSGAKLQEILFNRLLMQSRKRGGPIMEADVRR